MAGITMILQTKQRNCEQTTQNLIDQLAGWGLLTHARAEQLRSSQRSTSRSRSELLSDLVYSGDLTPLQSNRIAAGEGESLFWGPYILLRQIGKGGMGDVYLARHRSLQRNVAIKMLAARFAGHVEMRLRFEREVRAIGKINHPGFATALDAGEERGIPYLVMEYVSGQDLATIVQKKGAFRARTAVRILLQVARALQFAHDQKILHRDIKPQNLQMQKSGDVRVLDLGLARFLNSGSVDDEATLLGSMVGTADYISPEQAADSRRADLRSEVYSLGATLYFLMNGKSMYSGRSIVDKLLAHRQEAIPDLDDSELRGLNAIFKTMVAKSPEDRYQSMAEVIAALRELLQRRQTRKQVVLQPLENQTPVNFQKKSNRKVPDTRAICQVHEETQVWE
ncbi:MAG: serine/threonine protein kinase [Planctomycetaceae bacterium]|nr:serine/threonine protein kinase [Planctomycetaceae bacterium]